MPLFTRNLLGCTVLSVILLFSGVAAGWCRPWRVRGRAGRYCYSLVVLGGLPGGAGCAFSRSLRFTQIVFVNGSSKYGSEPF